MEVSGLQERLSGFDVPGALERLGGMDDLYVEVLRSFCDEQADAITQVRTSLAAGDGAGARRIAHTLKGLAGTVGATALEASAVALEQGIDAGLPAESLEPLVADCGVALDGAIASIRSLD